MSQKRRGRAGPAGRVRIIGGEWRGRRLPVALAEGLRPTPDRVRETLFNWLGPRLAGARCLDLFAGSGALGFEAASRGAAEVVLVESDPVVAKQLAANREVLGGEGVNVVCGDGLAWLSATTEPFDIIFLDPPYRGALLANSVKLVHHHGLLAPGGRAYLESDVREMPVPEDWSVIRRGHAGQVYFALAAHLD